MKTFFTFKTLLLVLFASIAAHAQTDLKIGHVNLKQVIYQSPQLKAASEELAKEFESKQKKLKAMSATLQGLQDQYNRDAVGMKKEELLELKKKIVREQTSLQTEQRFFEEDLKALQADAERKVELFVQQTAQKIAKSEKYDLVIYQGALFASDRIDLTDKVLEELNKKK